jgi:hypothetical protein
MRWYYCVLELTLMARRKGMKLGVPSGSDCVGEACE